MHSQKPKLIDELCNSIRTKHYSLRTEKSYVQASGVTKRISPHSFRHAMATHLLRNHADLRHIQAIFLYAETTTTELYTHLSLEDLKEAVRRSHPHGKK